MASEVTWIEVSSGRVFRIPADEQLPIGDAVVRNLKGERLEVDLDALAQFAVPREDAFRQIKDDLGGLLGGLSQGLKGEAEKFEPTMRELGDRIRDGIGQAQVADALDGVGDRLKFWASALRSTVAAKEPEGADPDVGPKLCPACFSVVVGPGPCVSCDFDLALESPVTMTPLAYADADRCDCGACGAPILVRARRCAACGARQVRAP
jgi:hypothetical protein